MKQKRQISVPFSIGVILGILFIFLPLEIIGFRLNTRIGATIKEQIITNIAFYASKNIILIFNISCIYESYR